MKKIKDLIYDFNDIFVAVLILAVAAVIILWRVSAIMAYSDYVDNHTAVASSQDVDLSDVDLTLEEVDEYNDNPEEFNSDGTEVQDTDAVQDEGSEDTQTGDVQETENQSQQTADGDFVVNIPSGSSCAKIGSILAEAGACSSADDFVNAVTEKGVENKLKAGTYTIPKGSSMNEIVNILTL